MIIPLDTEKNFEKTTSFIIKVLEIIGTQGTQLNIIEAVYKPIDNVKLKDEKFKTIPLITKTRQSCPWSPYVFNKLLYVLTIAMKQLRNIKGIQIGKRKSTYLFFQDDMIVYTSEPG